MRRPGLGCSWGVQCPLEKGIFVVHRRLWFRLPNFVGCPRMSTPFTATATLSLAFRVTGEFDPPPRSKRETEGLYTSNPPTRVSNFTHHRPLPLPKRETEGFHGNGNPPGQSNPRFPLHCEPFFETTAFCANPPPPLPFRATGGLTPKTSDRGRASKSPPPCEQFFEFNTSLLKTQAFRAQPDPSTSHFERREV